MEGSPSVVRQDHGDVDAKISWEAGILPATITTRLRLPWGQVEACSSWDVALFDGLDSVWYGSLRQHYPLSSARGQKPCDSLKAKF
jgi:hypothetical protein